MREIKATDFKIIQGCSVSNQEQPLKPCYKDQTPSNRSDALMLTVFSAGLTGRDHAEVQALQMSRFARLVNRSMSEKRPEVRILVVENTPMLQKGERKALLCRNIVVSGMKEMK